MLTPKFWKNKKLSDFSPEEWEAVCQRCGHCCLVKLEDEDSGELCYTRIICRHFDINNRSCRVYKERCQKVPSCLKIAPQNIDSLNWMPLSCAYRILNQTGELPTNHPLNGGTPPPLPQNLIADNLVAEDALEDYIVEDEEL